MAACTYDDYDDYSPYELSILAFMVSQIACKFLFSTFSALYSITLALFTVL